MADEAQTQVRGVQVDINLDAPADGPSETIAGLLQRADAHAHRAFVRSARGSIAHVADRIVEMRPEAGSYWTTALQHSFVEDVLSQFLESIEAAVRADLKNRLLLDLAVTVAPRLSHQEGTS